MALPSRWIPALGAVVAIGGLLAATRLASRHVGPLAVRTAQGLRPLALDASGPGSAAGADGRAPAPGDDTGGPVVDLDRPSERDWDFLLDVLANGTPEARVSAARALALVADTRAVDPLVAAAQVPGPDRDLFCMAALEVIRLQRREEALPALLRLLVDPGLDLTVACRAEISDRFVVAGGRDPAVLAEMADDPSPEVRAFVAGYLAEVASPSPEVPWQAPSP